jgi:hypothetical protein
MTDLKAEGYAFRCRDCRQMTGIHPTEHALRVAVQDGDVPPLNIYEQGGWHEGHNFDLVRISKLTAAAEAAADAQAPAAAGDGLTPFLFAAALGAWREFAREHDLGLIEYRNPTAAAFITTYLNRLTNRRAADQRG